MSSAPREAARQKLWDDMGAMLCDACGRKIAVKRSRPYQDPTLAKAGYAHVLCTSCAHDGIMGRSIGRFFLRVLMRTRA
jgi:hypothetical protein